ncbi:MAG TPA: glycine zipper domain-containing protein [Chlamydiales bacterium]|nr:glycine zipper domain-containing protein [Chlamydiales bacterium]
MNKNNFNELVGIDKIFCGIAGAIVGFLLGGVIAALVGALIGGFVGYLLEKDLKKIKI